MNKVRAVLLPAWCTSKEAEGGSGPWVTVSIWPWPPGLGRWFNVETAPRHPPALLMFRFCVDKVRTAITWEGIFLFCFQFQCLKRKRENKSNNKVVALDFKVSSKSVAGNDRSQKVKLATVCSAAATSAPPQINPLCDVSYCNREAFWTLSCPEDTFKCVISGLILHQHVLFTAKCIFLSMNGKEFWKISQQAFRVG